LHVTGSLAAVVVLSVANALLGMSFGLLVSAFASSEFQAVQFMPAFLMPQLLLCGLVVNRDAIARPLAWVARVLPMTYAYDGLDELRRSSGFGMSAVADLAVIVVGSVVALAVGAGTLRRRTA
jgi:ABC-2 type transport system permease protein